MSSRRSVSSLERPCGAVDLPVWDRTASAGRTPTNKRQDNMLGTPNAARLKEQTMDIVAKNEPPPPCPPCPDRIIRDSKTILGLAPPSITIRTLTAEEC